MPLPVLRWRVLRRMMQLPMSDAAVARDAVAGNSGDVREGREGCEAEEAVETESVTDELDGSPVVRELLGNAFEPLALFHAKLMAEGEPRGLIGPRDVPIVWERHILNSAAIVPFVRDAVADADSVHRTIADIGSGGGFPGLVVAACLPDCAVTLIEPMERRVEWLAECVELMGLTNVTVRRARAEELIAALKQRSAGGSGKKSGGTGSRRRRGGRGAVQRGRGGVQAAAVADASGKLAGASRELGSESVNENDSLHGTGAVAAGVGVAPERFTVVTCRAVAPMTKLSGWTLPLLAPGGRLVALKGRSAQAEIEKAAKEISKAHGMNPRVVEAPVGPGLEPTHVVLVDKR